MKASHLLGLAALACAAPASAANVLTNAGFESGSLAPWTSLNTPFVTSAEARSGTYSVAAFAADQIRQDFAAVATSLVSEVSIWVKRQGGPFDSYAFYYDDNTSQNFLINGIGQGDDWLYFNLTSNLAAGKNLNGFSIFGTSPGPAYFDDVLIDVGGGVVPEPATWAVLVLGFGVMGGAMRRRRASLRFA